LDLQHPVHSFQEVARVANVAVVNPLDGQDRGCPVHAGNSGAVIAGGSDDPGDVRAVSAIVAVVVHGVADARDDVITVGARRAAGDAGVGPDVGDQVGMGVLHAQI